MRKFKTIEPRATARPVIESVSERLGVDTDVLIHLFSACLDEVLKQSEVKGSCTIRGIGKFTQVSLPVKSPKKVKSNGEVTTVFERAKHVPVNRPFHILKTKTRVGQASDEMPQSSGQPQDGASQKDSN